MSHCELEEVMKHINDKISLVKRLLELRAVGMADLTDFSCFLYVLFVNGLLSCVY